MVKTFSVFQSIMQSKKWNKRDTYNGRDGDDNIIEEEKEDNSGEDAGENAGENADIEANEPTRNEADEVDVAAK